ncbi:MAG: hypothetical protein AAB116_25380 [Candidatus Poribacteria bacterium]
MTEIVDLWPDTIKVEKMITPVIILRQQASLLGKKTKNIIQGKVEKGTDDTNGLFDYTLYIVAPALNDYRYRLLSISYGIHLYPLTIKIEDEEILSEIPPKFSCTTYKSGISIKPNSEEEFKEVLKAIFNSKKVLRVISVLLSQSDPSYDPSLKEGETQQ